MEQNSKQSIITNNANNNSATVKFSTSTTSPVLLTVSANNGCGSSIVKTFSIAVNFACRTAVDGAEVIDEEFNVYPNPVSNKVNVVLNGRMIKEGDISVYDVLGNNLPIHVLNISENNGAELDFSTYMKGMYIIRINVEETYRIFRVIKE